MTQRPHKRILIGAASCADADSALRLARILATTGTVDLGGLFVSERTLEARAAMPGQRIITTSGSMILAPDKNQIRTLLQSEQRAFHENLSRFAQSVSAVWNFESRSGDLIQEVSGAARSWDILLLGYRATHRRRGSVVVIEPPAGAPNLRELGTALATALDTDAVILSIGVDPSPNHQTFSSSAALLDHLSRLHAAAVVVDLSASLFRSFQDLRALMDIARCPIIITKPAEGELRLEHTAHIPPVPT